MVAQQTIPENGALRSRLPYMLAPSFSTQDSGLFGHMLGNLRPRCRVYSKVVTDSTVVVRDAVLQAFRWSTCLYLRFDDVGEVFIVDTHVITWYHVS